MITLNKTYSIGWRSDPVSTEDVWNFCNIAPGWEGIIHRLLLDLDKPEMVWDNAILQVKEKFGTLRFYIGYGSDAVFKRIDEAGIESSKTCFKCGKPGKLRTGGWWETTCDEHSGEKVAYDEDPNPPEKPFTLTFFVPVAEAGIGTSPTN